VCVFDGVAAWAPVGPVDLDQQREGGPRGFARATDNVDEQMGAVLN